MATEKKRITLIGAPSDAGAGTRGASMAPEALRVAGIAKSIRRLGFDVTDIGNLSGPVNPEHPREGRYRHLEEVTAWCGLAKTAVSEALQADSIPVLMGGDHSLSIGSIAAVAEHCSKAERPLTVLWMDAHSDFNDAVSSPTGNLHGMPVAILAGHGPEVLTGLGAAKPIVPPESIIQIGVRSVDEIEKRLVVDSGLIVYDMRQIDEVRMRTIMAQALDKAATIGGHLHLSLDIDFLDPTVAPGVPTTVPGGPTYREAQLCMEMIHDSGLMGSLDIMEINPALDDRNRTATVAVELVESLFGEQILARAHDEPSRYGL